MDTPNKKASILLVLKTLQKYSDETHYLKQQDIIRKIQNDYGIEIGRKSVGDSIKLLKELEYGIEENPDNKGGVALLERQFEPGQARFLIDAVFSSRAITAKDACELAKKIQEGFSEYMQKDYGYVAKGSKLSRSSNNWIMYNIELINKAIKERKQISFQLTKYDEKGETLLEDNGKVYLASPYFIVCNLGRYYLLALPSGGTKMVRYRLDKINEPHIEGREDYQNPETILGEGFDISNYLDEHIHMLDGEVVDALIRIEPKIEGREGNQTGKGVGFVRDWFGDKAKIFKNESDGFTYAKFRCDASSLFYWIMQYSEEFTLIEPEDRVEEIRTYLKMYLKKYGEN